MGYRSDVVLVLSQKGSDLLKERVKELSEELKEEVKDLFTCSEEHFVTTLENDELWYWTWFKWYSDYAAISFIETFLHELDDNEFVFMRIGEDYTDVEAYGGYYDNPFEVEIKRKISFCTNFCN